MNKSLLIGAVLGVAAATGVSVFAGYVAPGPEP